MTNLFTNGAECSGTNAVQGLMKQYSRDRSLQQDQISRGDPRAHHGRSVFRHEKLVNSSLTDEFLNASAVEPKDSFEFNALSKELVAIPHGPMEEMSHHGWADDFVREQTGPEWEAFDQAFSAAQMSGWEAEFARFDAPPPAVEAEMHQQFEKAFEEAGKEVTWEQEFNKQNNWANEFEQSMPMDSRTALAVTAGEVVNIINESNNPKFKQSGFLQLMRKLRDQEVVVEGNKIVEQHAPATSNWAAEFSQEKPASSWAAEFSQEKPADNWAAEFSGRPDNWADAFHGESSTNATWAKEFEQSARGDEDQWATQFEQQQQQQAQPSASSTSLGEQWAKEFSEREASLPDLAEQRLQEWTEMYRKNIEPLTHDPQDKEWEALAKAWEAQTVRESEGLGYSANMIPEYDVYTFYPNNPYLARPTSMSAAQTHAQQRSLHDEILEHEAVVQLDPTNAEAWRRLGLLQQENERDAAAIAAFRNAIRHAPHGVPTGDTRIALAVAYANENCLGDAYKELENWIVEHPIYGRAAGKAPIYDETIQDRHTRVEQAMIRAVQSRPDVLDAELQAALGVLFNLAGEPQKAMDCFRAAVQARPADHLLWNRLGASLAHAGQFPEALDAYRQALELRPGYVRARYNIGIACINLNLYREAAEHLLTALALQLPKIEPGQSTAPVSGTMPSTATTDSLWRALKMTMNLLERPDLAAHCDDRNLNAFRNDFEF